MCVLSSVQRNTPQLKQPHRDQSQRVLIWSPDKELGSCFSGVVLIAALSLSRYLPLQALFWMPSLLLRRWGN